MPRPAGTKWNYAQTTVKTNLRRDPKKVAAYRNLVRLMELNGMNTWDARIAARKLLDHPVGPERNNFTETE